jgi:hypothetical protein
MVATGCGEQRCYAIQGMARRCNVSPHPIYHASNDGRGRLRRCNVSLHPIYAPNMGIKGKIFSTHCQYANKIFLKLVACDDK